MSYQLLTCYKKYYLWVCNENSHIVCHLCSQVHIFMDVQMWVLTVSTMNLCWGQRFLYPHWKSQGFWLNKNLSTEWKGLECRLMLLWPRRRLKCTAPYTQVMTQAVCKTLLVVIMTKTGRIILFYFYHLLETNKNISGLFGNAGAEPTFIFVSIKTPG